MKRGGKGSINSTVSGLAGLLLLLIFGWIWNELEYLEDRKADRNETADRWTGSQQDEYRKAVQAEIAAIRREIEKLERRIEELEHGTQAATR